jgi:hypothetical protein
MSFIGPKAADAAIHPSTQVIQGKAAVDEVPVIA